MSSKKILEEDWSDYDDKSKKKHDSHFFSCEEDWEVNYLVGKIRKNYPDVSEEDIKKAIEQCCKTVHAPRPRKRFVECVMNRLGLDDGNSGGGNPPPNPGQGPKNPPKPPEQRPVG